jgi:hypothetical protein
MEGSKQPIKKATSDEGQVTGEDGISGFWFQVSGFSEENSGPVVRCQVSAFDSGNVGAKARLI